VRLNAGLPDMAAGRYQTVLANILATPLKVLAPLLCAHVAGLERQAELKAAGAGEDGILERQADEPLQSGAGLRCPACGTMFVVPDQLRISGGGRVQRRFDDGWILTCR
jgi:hypothetical protein